MQHNPLRINVLGLDVFAPFPGDQIHDGADIISWREYLNAHPGFANRLNLTLVGKFSGAGYPVYRQGGFLCADIDKRAGKLISEDYFFSLACIGQRRGKGAGMVSAGRDRPRRSIFPHDRPAGFDHACQVHRRAGKLGSVRMPCSGNVHSILLKPIKIDPVFKNVSIRFYLAHFF